MGRYLTILSRQALGLIPRKLLTNYIYISIPSNDCGRMDYCNPACITYRLLIPKHLQFFGIQIRSCSAWLISLLRLLVLISMKWRMQVQNKYEAKRREFELMFSLEDRMEDVQKAMLMEKLMDDYWLTEHDGDIENYQ